MAQFCLKISDLVSQLSQDHIPLPTNVEVSIGRGSHVTVQILTSRQGVADKLSRKHAIFRELSPGNWSVTDNKSVNGISVNRVRIPPNTSHPLEAGDIIQLGIPIVENEDSPFTYTFVKESHDEGEVCQFFNASKRSGTTSTLLKRKHSPTEASTDKKPNLSHSEQDLPQAPAQGSSSSQLDFRVKGSRSEGHLTPDGPQHRCQKQSLAGANLALQQKLEEEQRMAQEKIEQTEKQLRAMKSALCEKESRQSDLQQQVEQQQAELEEHKLKLEREKEMAKKEICQEMEKEINQREMQLGELKSALNHKESVQCLLEREVKGKEEELAQQRQRLKVEKEEIEKNMKMTLEKELKEKEREMAEKLQAEKEALTSERQKIEENLLQEMERKLKEKDKEMKEELTKYKDKEEVDKILLEENMRLAKEKVFQNITSVIENEFECVICNELFIKATTLNCSHTFCEACIDQWKKKKRQSSCPVCRQDIQHCNRSLVLDNYIDKMIQNLSQDLQEKRKALVAERQKSAEEAAKKPKSKKAATAAGAARGGQQPIATVDLANQGGPASRTRGAASTANPDQSLILVEDSSSESDDSGSLGSYEGGDEDEGDFDDSDMYYGGRHRIYLHESEEQESDDEDSDPGEPGVYYGGYGRCFLCGRRGHWANGCPLRT